VAAFDAEFDGPPQQPGPGLGATGHVTQSGLGIPERVFGRATELRPAQALAQVGELGDQDVDLIDGVTKRHALSVRPSASNSKHIGYFCIHPAQPGAEPQVSRRRSGPR